MYAHRFNIAIKRVEEMEQQKNGAITFLLQAGQLSALMIHKFKMYLNLHL